MSSLRITWCCPFSNSHSLINNTKKWDFLLTCGYSWKISMIHYIANSRNSRRRIRTNIQKILFGSFARLSQKYKQDFFMSIMKNICQTTITIRIGGKEYNRKQNIQLLIPLINKNQHEKIFWPIILFEKIPLNFYFYLTL